ncbi:unnamed protein product [Amoebophrya sp. A25]|nr:unnamed protein product [Amoebophrya sp. A25]|eukprot:GSA25T00019219001.1
MRVAGESEFFVPDVSVADQLSEQWIVDQYRQVTAMRLNRYMTFASGIRAQLRLCGLGIECMLVATRDLYLRQIDGTAKRMKITVFLMGQIIGYFVQLLFQPLDAVHGIQLSNGPGSQRQQREALEDRLAFVTNILKDRSRVMEELFILTGLDFSEDQDLQVGDVVVVYLRKQAERIDGMRVAALYCLHVMKIVTFWRCSFLGRGGQNSQFEFVQQYFELRTESLRSAMLQKFLQAPPPICLSMDPGSVFLFDLLRLLNELADENKQSEIMRQILFAFDHMVEADTDDVEKFIGRAGRRHGLKRDFKGLSRIDYEAGIRDYSSERGRLRDLISATEEQLVDRKQKFDSGPVYEGERDAYRKFLKNIRGICVQQMKNKKGQESSVAVEKQWKRGISLEEKRKLQEEVEAEKRRHVEECKQHALTGTFEVDEEEAKILSLKPHCELQEQYFESVETCLFDYLRKIRRPLPGRFREMLLQQLLDHGEAHVSNSLLAENHPDGNWWSQAVQEAKDAVDDDRITTSSTSTRTNKKKPPKDLFWGKRPPPGRLVNLLCRYAKTFKAKEGKVGQGVPKNIDSAGYIAKQQHAANQGSSRDEHDDHSDDEADDDEDSDSDSEEEQAAQPNNEAQQREPSKAERLEVVAEDLPELLMLQFDDENEKGYVVAKTLLKPYMWLGQPVKLCAAEGCYIFTDDEKDFFFSTDPHRVFSKFRIFDVFLVDTDAGRCFDDVGVAVRREIQIRLPVPKPKSKAEAKHKAKPKPQAKLGEGLAAQAKRAPAPKRQQLPLLCDPQPAPSVVIPDARVGLASKAKASAKATAKPKLSKPRQPKQTVKAEAKRSLSLAVQLQGMVKAPLLVQEDLVALAAPALPSAISVSVPVPLPSERLPPPLPLPEAGAAKADPQVETSSASAVLAVVAAPEPVAVADAVMVASLADAPMPIEDREPVETDLAVVALSAGNVPNSHREAKASSVAVSPDVAEAPGLPPAPVMSESSGPVSPSKRVRMPKAKLHDVDWFDASFEKIMQQEKGGSTASKSKQAKAKSSAASTGNAAIPGAETKKRKRALEAPVKTEAMRVSTQRRETTRHSAVDSRWVPLGFSVAPQGASQYIAQALSDGLQEQVMNLCRIPGMDLQTNSKKGFRYMGADPKDPEDQSYASMYLAAWCVRVDFFTRVFYRKQHQEDLLQKWRDKWKKDIEEIQQELVKKGVWGKISEKQQLIFNNLLVLAPVTARMLRIPNLADDA